MARSPYVDHSRYGRWPRTTEVVFHGAIIPGTLGFDLGADATHCVECRKVAQGLARYRRHYEALFHQDRTGGEDLSMAERALEQSPHHPSRPCPRLDASGRQVGGKWTRSEPRPLEPVEGIN